MFRFEQIEQYLTGKMPPAERQAFETEMARDPELDALVRQHRIERIGLELLVEQDLRAKMRAWDRETELFQQLQPRRARIRPLTWVLRAAAVVAALAVGYWLLRDRLSDAPAQPDIVQTQPKPQKQVPTWRKPSRQPSATGEPNMAQNELPPAPIEEMQPGSVAIDYAAVADEFFAERDFLPPRGAKGGSKAYLEGLKNLQDGRYQDITNTLKPELVPTPTIEDVQQQELLAVAYYRNGQYADAEMAFRRIVISRVQPYAQRAEWGVVLAILKQMPQRQSALDAALDVVLRQPEHQFYAKAQQLRERL